VLIQGSGFGAAQGTGFVTIGGVAAPLTRWSDTLIAAYVPEAAATGAAGVQVFTANGSTNPVNLNVTLRPAPSGHVRWRFKVDGDYIQSRPAADGTVYTQDVFGHLYAVSASGALKWIFNAPGVGFGEVTLGPDGTVYLGNQFSIFAVGPDGVQRWKFDQNPGALTLYGPNVGPDGNIYAVSVAGMGTFSLTPQGSLRWSAPEPLLDLLTVFFQEVVFGPASQPQLYFHGNTHLRSFRFDGTEAFAYTDFLGISLADPQPNVAPDGSVYTNIFSALVPA
jgi:outer membrane protein assembly factor BamB